MDMTTRAELKSRAKECLRHYYWWAFLACLLAGLLGGGNSDGVDFQFNVSSSLGTGAAGGNAESAENMISQMMNPGAFIATMMIFAVVFTVALVIAVCWGTFLGNPVRVGNCRYFMESRERMQSAGIGRLFYVFEGGRYGNVVKVMFMRGLFTFLWTLLLIVPGIIKSYEYYLVPYILQDDPQMDYRDALKLSKDMMDGYKWNLFVLQLSFIGWEILGGLCCGIGLMFLRPYKDATYAEFYAERRNEKWVVVENIQQTGVDQGAWESCNGDWH